MKPVAVGQFTTGRTRSLRLIKFGLVGLSGYVVNTAALAVFADMAGVHYLLGAILATQVSTTWNYVFTDTWVYGFRETRRGQLSRFSLFWLMNNATLPMRLPIMWVLTSVLGVHHLISNVISLGVVTIARFWASDSFIWGSK